MVPNYIYDSNITSKVLDIDNKSKPSPKQSTYISFILLVFPKRVLSQKLMKH